MRMEKGFSLNTLTPIGEIVRGLRKNKGMTLKDLAEASGMSISAVSKVEKGQVSPTFETIVRLADGLRVEVTELFGPSSAKGAEGRIVVTRSGKGVRHDTPHYSYEMHSAELARKKFTPLVTRINARSVDQFRRLESHAGEEYFYVLSGKVVLHTEHYAPVELAVGDGAYYDSRMGHALTSGSEEPATVLWIASNVIPPLTDPK